MREPAADPATQADSMRALMTTAVSSRADRILLAGLVLSGAYGLAMTPVAPSLVGTHPILLEILRGSPASMITAGGLVRTGEASLVVALLAGLIGCIMFDWLFWWAGRRWGEHAIAFLTAGRPRLQRWTERLRAIMARRGSLVVLVSYVLPIPTTVVDVIAGWGGMSLRRFLILDAISAMFWVGGLVGLGYALGQTAVDIASAISRYGLVIGVGIVVVMVLRGARQSPLR